MANTFIELETQVFQKAFGSTTPVSKTFRDTSMVGGSMCKRTELFCPCPQEAKFEIEAFLGGFGQVAKMQEIEFGYAWLKGREIDLNFAMWTYCENRTREFEFHPSIQ